MRHRIARAGFVAMFCWLAFGGATPAVFSGFAASRAVAAGEDDLEMKAAEKTGKSATTGEVRGKIAEDRGLDEEAIGAKPPKKESFLAWLYHSLQFRYTAIFLIITFNAVALMVMIVLGLRRDNICPDDLALAFEAKLNQKQYQEAYELVKEDKSFLGMVLTAGMSKVSEGYDSALEAMQEVGEEQNLKLEQRNGYIALIAQLGPMFGLLGTVDGMVMAFGVIAQSNVTPKPSDLAQGIGTALVTTVVGLWIAIPSIAFYHFVRNRLTRLVLEAGLVGGSLMKRFSTIQISIRK